MLNNKERADLFFKWYAANKREIKRRINITIDEDVLSETALRIYTIVADKGKVIDDNMRYYLSAYRTNYLKFKSKRAHEVYDDMPEMIAEDEEAPIDLSAQMYAEVLEYVRGQFDEIAVAIFEIYVTCYPDISYPQIAQLTGIPFVRVKNTLSSVRRDVVMHYAEKRKSILSI